MDARAVDLPAPLAPSSARVRPCATEKLEVEVAPWDADGRVEAHRAVRDRRVTVMTTVATTTRTSESATAAWGSVSRWR